MSVFWRFRSDLRWLGSAAAVLTIVVLVSGGCTRGTNARPVAEETRLPPKDAMAVLERVVEAYHKADRYKDDGRLVLQYTKGGKTYQDTSKFALTLAGPNRLHLRAYDALVVCDGQNFRATIDEAPGEVLSVAAPEELSPGAVYRDTVLGKALNQIVGSVPLSLFLDPDPLPGFQFNARSPQLDEPEKIGGDLCYRVRIAHREGAMVLWIDQKTFVVRRVEYPAVAYRQYIERYPGEVSGMTITAEHDNAMLDPPIDDEEFRFEVPPDAEMVKQFDAVFVGARIPKFKLRSPDGAVITRDSLDDKVAVIKFWQKDDIAKYHEDLASFEEVRKRYQEQSEVAFLSVNTDDEKVSDAELQAELDKAQITLPLTRIDVSVAFRSFGLHVVPTTVILGRHGSLQEYLPGVYPDQAVTLPKKIDTLLSGGELVLEAPEKPLDYTYYSAFSYLNTPASEEEGARTMPAEFAKAEIAPASEPEFLRLKRLWACSELKAPGNLLVVHEASGDRIFVIDESSRIVQLSADGQVSMMRKLELLDEDPAQARFLRTAVDGAGKRFFLASAAGSRQVYLFDADWKRRLVYPDEDQQLPIADVQLADLDGDGKLEMLVGYLGLVGTHCVGLDGKTIWRNRAAENVFGLGITAADRQSERQLLVAQGMLLPVNASGNEQTPFLLADAFIRLIYTSDLGQAELSPWCAIAMRVANSAKRVRDVAIGMSPRGTVLWRYPLPAGTHHHASFEMVACGDLFGAGMAQWVIAAADGSIHMLTMDGSLLDRYNSGVSPSGLGIANLGGQPALLIANDEGVEAWQFELPPEENSDASPETP